MGPQTLWNEYFYRNLTTSTMGWTKDQLQHSWCQGPEIAPPAAAKVDSFAWDRECRDTTFFFLPFWSFWKDNLDKRLFGSAKFTHSSLQPHFKFWIWAFTPTFRVHIHSSFGDQLEKSGRTVYGTLIQGNTGDYTIFLDKSTGARLGIDVDHKDSRPGASRIVFTGWSYCNAGLVQFGLIISGPDNDICLISMATLGMTHQPKGNPWPWPSIVNQRWALLDPRWSTMDYTIAVSASLGAQDGETLLIEVINPGLVQVRRWGHSLGSGVRICVERCSRWIHRGTHGLLRLGSKLRFCDFQLRLIDCKT